MKEPVFNNGFAIFDCTWTELKNLCESKIMFMQYVDKGPNYYIFAVDENLLYKHEIYKDSSQLPENWEFSAGENDAALNDFVDNYKPSANKPLRRRQKDGSYWASLVDLHASELIETTINYANKSTWYDTAERITNQTLTANNDHTQYSCPNGTVIINMEHGKIFDEDVTAAELDPVNLFKVKVYVNDVLKTMREPFKTSGGDYEVDYLNGKIIFFNALTNTDVVKADYHKAVNSKWALKPLEGKVLEINYAEVDVSADIIMNDTIVFNVYGLVDVFAPELVNNNIIPSGTHIIIDTTKYKTINQLRQEAIGTTPAEPPCGGPIRGVTQDWRTMPFRYRATKILWASRGMYLEISLENDLAFDGENATATFHCLSRDESDFT